MRILKLVFGFFVIIQALDTKQYILLGFAAFFIFQGIFNLGCSSNGCNIDFKDDSKENEK